jgi:cysteine/O-acetylserine efflux protein
MSFPILPFAAFSIVTIFTPGPNNISSMGFGFQYGYRGTLKYLFGICIGVFVMFMAASLFSSLIGKYIPKVMPILKYVGAAYIIFLGIQMMRTKTIDKKGTKKKAGLVQGIFLQLLNPKGLIYSLTVFTVFIHPNFETIWVDFIFAGILLIFVFLSISLYTIGGNVVKVFIKRERVYRGVSIILGLALFYSAAAIIFTDLTFQ